MSYPTEETLISSISQALVETVGGAVSGIKLAADPPPPKLDTGELPAMWCFVGQATDEALGSGLVLVQRAFRVQVAVIPTGQGNPRTREELVRPLIGRVKAAFRQHTSLAVAAVQSVTVAGDSGVVILPEYGGAFIGFQLTLEVAYVVKRTYVD